MNRCFGTVDRTRISSRVNGAMLKCVLGERITPFAKWTKIFSSLLAKRFFTHCYFPIRADSDSSTLCEVAMEATQSMSATSFKSSASSLNDFPKETTFQHLFTLSWSFAMDTKVKEEIDFFVDGDRMWGIEVVRSGAKIGEHMSHFGSRGKHAGLQSSDYVVLDFCKSIAYVIKILVERPHFFLLTTRQERLVLGKWLSSMGGMMPSHYICNHNISHQGNTRFLCPTCQYVHSKLNIYKCISQNIEIK
ncbi:hypothetical protein Plhal304r1_c019g0068041 [Plasmopara halstedii]